MVEDLTPEVEGLSQFAQDARFALELSYRIDKGLVFQGIAEVLDGPIAFLVALVAVGVWRHQRRMAVPVRPLVDVERATRPDRLRAIKRRERLADRTAELDKAPSA